MVMILTHTKTNFKAIISVWRDFTIFFIHHPEFNNPSFSFLLYFCHCTLNLVSSSFLCIIVLPSPVTWTWLWKLVLSPNAIYQNPFFIISKLVRNKLLPLFWVHIILYDSIFFSYQICEMTHFLSFSISQGNGELLTVAKYHFSKQFFK